MASQRNLRKWHAHEKLMDAIAAKLYDDNAKDKNADETDGWHEAFPTSAGTAWVRVEHHSPSHGSGWHVE